MPHSSVPHVAGSAAVADMTLGQLQARLEEIGGAGLRWNIWPDTALPHSVYAVGPRRENLAHGFGPDLATAVERVLAALELQQTRSKR